jgi:predicted flavoprotein YhiN
LILEGADKPAGKLAVSGGGRCNFTNVPYKAKDWAELKEQLLVAGLFTEYITNFSWVTFKKGTNNYEGYKIYLKENNLLP